MSKNALLFNAKEKNLSPFLDLCVFWSVIYSLQVCSRRTVQDFLLANADNIGEPLAFLLLLLPISLISYFFVALAYTTYTPKQWKMILGPKVISFQYLCKALFFMLLALFSLSAIVLYFSEGFLQGYSLISYVGGRERENYTVITKFPWANALLHCIVLPFQEGIIYRGMIYQHFRRPFGKFASTILSSAFLFALYFDVGIGFAVFRLGLFLAISSQITGSIVPSIIFHGLMSELVWYNHLVCM